MKFILYISTRIRHGQFPKLPEFKFSNEHGKYIYGGRELTGEELNAACDVVYSERYYSKGFQFRPLVIMEPVAQTPPPDAAPPEFTLSDTSIMLGDEKIGGLFQPGPHLRVLAPHKDLRPAIEEWLKSQTTDTP